MKLPLDVRCLECAQIFCCAKCRKNHEQLRHGIMFDCHLCRFHSLTLDTKTMSQELLEHVVKNHLPLGCKKCGTLFNKREDFDNINEACCGDLAKQEHTSSLPDAMEITPKTPVSQTDAENFPIPDAKLFEYLKVKLKSKSEVMTSTPTNYSLSQDWCRFQKSFTSSTLSGINSPETEVVQSPPTDGQKDCEANSPSEILSTIDSPPVCVVKALKSIISNKESPRVENGELAGQEDASPHTGVSSGGGECSNLSNKTPQDSSANRKKSVSFADQVLAPRRKSSFEFLRPRRTCTPAKLKQSYVKTPRFQAIINNFGFKTSNKEFDTPKQNRFSNPDETPPTAAETNNTNVLAGRAIQFKEDSPTLNSMDTSPVTSHDKITMDEDESNNFVNELKPFAMLTPLERDITALEHYKSCIETPVETVTSDKNQALPQLIAKSIQEMLDSALNSQDYTTEIQLSIKITKKTVCINEKTKVLDQVREERSDVNNQQNVRQVEKESTTIWSRLVSGLKWVVWGEDTRWNCTPKGLTKTEGEDRLSLVGTSSALKRKRHGSYFYGESPVSKRYRGLGKIRGRRPLDRVLRGGVVLPERSQTTDDTDLKQKMTSPSEDHVLNRSF